MCVHVCALMDNAYKEISKCITNKSLCIMYKLCSLVSLPLAGFGG